MAVPSPTPLPPHARLRSAWKGLVHKGFLKDLNKAAAHGHRLAGTVPSVTATGRPVDDLQSLTRAADTPSDVFAASRSFAAAEHVLGFAGAWTSVREAAQKFRNARRTLADYERGEARLEMLEDHLGRLRQRLSAGAGSRQLGQVQDVLEAQAAATRQELDGRLADRLRAQSVLDGHGGIQRDNRKAFGRYAMSAAGSVTGWAAHGVARIPVAALGASRWVGQAAAPVALNLAWTGATSAVASERKANRRQRTLNMLAESFAVSDPELGAIARTLQRRQDIGIRRSAVVKHLLNVGGYGSATVTFGASVAARFGVMGAVGLASTAMPLSWALGGAAATTAVGFGLFKFFRHVRERRAVGECREALLDPPRGRLAEAFRHRCPGIADAEIQRRAWDRMLRLDAGLGLLRLIERLRADPGLIQSSDRSLAQPMTPEGERTVAFFSRLGLSELEIFAMLKAETVESAVVLAADKVGLHVSIPRGVMRPNHLQPSGPENPATPRTGPGPPADQERPGSSASAADPRPPETPASVDPQALHEGRVWLTVHVRMSHAEQVVRVMGGNPAHLEIALDDGRDEPGQRRVDVCVGRLDERLADIERTLAERRTEPVAPHASRPDGIETLPSSMEARLKEIVNRLGLVEATLARMQQLQCERLELVEPHEPEASLV